MGEEEGDFVGEEDFLEVSKLRRDSVDAVVEESDLEEGLSDGSDGEGLDEEELDSEGEVEENVDEGDEEGGVEGSAGSFSLSGLSLGTSPVRVNVGRSLERRSKKKLEEEIADGGLVVDARTSVKDEDYAEVGLEEDREEEETGGDFYGVNGEETDDQLYNGGGFD